MLGRYLVLAVPLLAVAVGAVGSAAWSAASLITQNYPAESLARGEQGVVGFAVELDRDANIDSCVVTKSSGYPRLDDATCDLLVRFAHFPPAETAGKRVATTRTGQLEWMLPDQYRDRAKMAPPPVVVTRASLEARRLICKRTKAPGSLTKLKTYCLTRTEWVQAADNSRQEGQEMIQPRQADHGCAMRC